MGAVAGGSRIVAAIAALGAALIVLPGVLRDCLRYASEKRWAVSSRTWLAIYPEWSNRTRHVLALARELPQPVPLLIIGKPRRSLSELESLLATRMPDARFELILPISFGAFLQALSRIIGTSFEIARDAYKRPYRLSLSKRTHILYRLELGCVYERWWSESGCKPDVVIYGHTGKADTSLLERQQQKQGTRTVHLLHGFSNGLGFAGISDLVIAKCRHDAEWHKRLYPAGESVSVPAPRPAPGEPKRRWALLTNFAHPMARPNVEAGVKREQEALRIVAAAARDLGVDPDEVIYRPHPALASLDRAAQSAVADTASAAGLKRWPEDLPLDALREFELVITTPSTVMQDALLAGTVPVLLDLAAADEASVYADYPLKARSQSELAELLRGVLADREAAFEQAWNSVGPGVNPAAAQIQAAVAQLPAVS